MKNCDKSTVEKTKMKKLLLRINCKLLDNFFWELVLSYQLCQFQAMQL